LLPRCRQLPPPHPFPTRRSSDLHGLRGALLHALLERLLQVLEAGAEVREVALHAGLLLQRELEATRHQDRALELLAVHRLQRQVDRKSTRLNSSHRTISYAVFCL